jgi:hypothetical protein
MERLGVGLSRGNRMGKEALFWAAVVFLVITGSIVISIALKYV